MNIESFKYYRNKYRMTQEEFGKILNVSKLTVHNIETGRTYFSEELRQKCLVVFGALEAEEDYEYNSSNYAFAPMSLSEKLKLFALPLEKIEAIYQYGVDSYYSFVKSTNKGNLKERLLDAFNKIRTAEQQEALVSLVERFVAPDVPV